MVITAGMVKELRERTGVGMMECKKALLEAGGDMNAAVDILRKAGAAKADKKAGRITVEGSVAVAQSQRATAIVEVNCETDFAARNVDFINFADRLAARILSARPTDLDALNAMSLDEEGGPVEIVLKNLVGKIGENVSVRRFQVVEGDTLGHYLHKVGGSCARIGVVVQMEGGDSTLATDIAMHIAAAKPQFIDRDQIDPAVLEKERQILTEQAEGSGKPPAIIEKMVAGKLNKFLQEITLLGQPFVKDPDTSVEKLLKASNAQVTSFVRFELGEGIEKKKENFADEVMAQVKAAR